jgi:hypothetical protein
MRYFKIAVIVLWAIAVALPSEAEDQKVAKPSAESQASPGQVAMQKAAAAKKYLFIHFWKAKSDQADKTWKALQSGAAKYADRADVISLQTTDPAEKAVVEQFKVAKSPMPMVVSVGPTGAVTKAFPLNFEEKQLESAFVSPCEEQVMKAVQDNKMIFVCIAYDAPKDGQPEIPQCVKDFKADEKYAKVTESVTLNATDEKEAKFLKELQDNTKEKKPVAVLLAPGALIGSFDDKADKKQIIAKIADSQSGCCPGGSCGPGGCGPKK